MVDTIIPNVVVSMPSQLFTLARAFKAAANGRIYIGKIDTDPTIPENQIQVYLENEDGTHVPIAQPIIINAGGYPVYGGQIAKFVTVQGHSMAVYDAYKVQQFYFSNVLKYDPDQLRTELAGGGGAGLVGKEGGGTVQDFINSIDDTIRSFLPWVTPEMFGAVGDGVADDTAAWQSAANTGANIVGKSGANYKLTYTVIFPEGGHPTLIDGGGCTITWTNKSAQPFDQYDSGMVRKGYTTHKSYQNMTLNGPVLPKNRYADVSYCHAINFSQGFARDLVFNGFTNCFRAYGDTFISNITADNLRNAVMSERNNNNHIENVKVGWCAGDVLVFYSQFCSANNITAEYAGVIPPDTEETAGAPRGALISTGQDGHAAECKYVSVSNIQCKWHGGGGVICSGDNISVAGVINVGSMYQSTALTSVRQLAVWVGGSNISVGDVFCGAVNTATTIQSGSINCTIGYVYVASQMVGVAPSLLSAFDVSGSPITRCRVQGIFMDGFVNTGNAVVLSTDGVVLDKLYIRSLGNTEANRTILLRGACKVGDIEIYNPGLSSAVTNTIETEGNPCIGRITMEAIYATCITVKSGSVPKIGDVHLRNLGNGGKPPIVINGAGSENHFWGSVHLNGDLGARPAMVGTLSMGAFYSPIPWVSLDGSKTAVVKFPPPTTYTL